MASEYENLRQIMDIINIHIYISTELYVKFRMFQLTQLIYLRFLTCVCAKNLGDHLYMW